jgi:hypothetical protein
MSRHRFPGSGSSCATLVQDKLAKHKQLYR